MDPLNSEYLLISEEDKIEATSGDHPFHESTFSKPLLFHTFVKHMGLVDLVTTKSQFALDNVSNAAFTNLEFLCHFSHGLLWVTLNPASDSVNVLGCCCTQRTTTTRTVLTVTKLLNIFLHLLVLVGINLEAFYCVIYCRFFVSSYTYNFRRPHTSFMQFNNCFPRTFIHY